MALKTGDEYLDSIKSLGLEAHILGQKTGNLPEHGLVGPSRRAVAFTYDCAHDPETRELFCVESPLCQDTVNRFTHLHQSTEDLVNKVKMQRYCGLQTGCCFQRCVGLDAANAIFSTTYECDREHGTSYHQRFRDYWKWIQQQDLLVDGAMTDPKGDRGKRPRIRGILTFICGSKNAHRKAWSSAGPSCIKPVCSTPMRYWLCPP